MPKISDPFPPVFSAFWDLSNPSSASYLVGLEIEEWCLTLADKAEKEGDTNVTHTAGGHFVPHLLLNLVPVSYLVSSSCEILDSFPQLIKYCT